MRQSGDAGLGYIKCMKIALAQLQLLLSVILLIAGGVIGQASATGSVAGVTASVATLAASASHRVMGPVASTDQENHRAPCDDCSDCMHATGFGCCTAGISASDPGVLDYAPVAIRFMAGRLFLATGIDPEALLHPPQDLA
ncbi:hypothetical protein MesoLj131a_35180 [Mesorhizobium sp. 131-2-1]|nr:hypothetical protein MesoLj131a_35180 [Mesorhizobium sp. 131-2-1]